eukprot:3941099-Rhodomonas_salina.2
MPVPKSRPAAVTMVAGLLSRIIIFSERSVVPGSESRALPVTQSTSNHTAPSSTLSPLPLLTLKSTLPMLRSPFFPYPFPPATQHTAF